MGERQSLGAALGLASATACMPSRVRRACVVACGRCGCGRIARPPPDVLREGSTWRPLTATTRFVALDRSRATRSWSSCASFPTTVHAWTTCGARSSRPTVRRRSVSAARSRAPTSATRAGHPTIARRAVSTSRLRPGRSFTSRPRRCSFGSTPCTSWLALDAGSRPNSWSASLA